jgi:radical SAM superfamily enzyme YgiQ (UPF0313 family)
MVLASLTPKDWQTTIVDENLGVPDYQNQPRPDLLGITAFTSQANRAYEIAANFRARGVPVVMGGIHATMCRKEAAGHVDSVVTGEGEEVWAQVLGDAAHGRLNRLYEGGLADITKVPPARHDLLPARYALGAIQTTRGCPLSCSFCSVTAFNGARYRQRPIPDVVEEFRSISEKRVFVVDDNLIGTAPAQIRRAKELFRALAAAKLGKRWVAQTTINFADDEELLALAAKAGCAGVFIGFESPTPEGLTEIGKRFNLAQARDFPASVRRIQRHHMMVAASFMIGLDVDRKGIGHRVARAATDYGVDNLNVSFLTPLPGTRLWEQMRAEERIPLDRFPQDWKYYTLMHPVARYVGLSLEGAIEEMTACNRSFYSRPRIARRMAGSVYHGRSPLFSLIHNLSSRRNSQLLTKAYAEFKREHGERLRETPRL